MRNILRSYIGHAVISAKIKTSPRLRAYFGAVAAILLAVALYTHYSPFLVPDEVWFLDEAEAFYHGLPILDHLDSMPLTGYYHSLLAHNLPVGWPGIFLPFAIISLMTISFAAGEELCGELCGTLSTMVTALAFLLIGGALVNWGRYFETAIFTLLTSLAAAALLYYRDSGRTRDAILLGLLTGCSLLCRSTFFLFPFFILVALRLWRGKLEITWRAAAAIALLPYGMLIPWWLMRAYTGQEFALFEVLRAKANIITGLLGYINTIDGSYQEALKLAGLNGTENLWVWGVKRFGADPWGLAFAVPQRLWTALTYNPLISLATLASLLTTRMDDKTKLLAAFLLYFVAVHLPMPVEPRYFIPALPLVAVLIARAATLHLNFNRAAPPGNMAARRAVYVLAAAALYGTAALYVNIWPYASRINSGDEAASLHLEMAAHPGDPWLLEEAKWARLLNE